MSETIYRGVKIPADVQDGDGLCYAQGWRDGVDAHYLRTVELARDKDNGRTRLIINESDAPAVRAFLSVVTDDLDTGRDIIRSMSPADRAVLSFFLRDTGRIVEEEDSLRDTAERRRARSSHPDIRD